MVSVDAVYQKVLALANKEQRGYITPQEFNLFADHAQKDIFRQYFYDLDQASRKPGNSTNYSDVSDIIKEKIAVFNQYLVNASLSNAQGDVEIDQFVGADNQPNLHKIIEVRVTGGWGGQNGTAIEEVSIENQSIVHGSPLLTNAINSHTMGYYVANANLDQGNKRSIRIYPILDLGGSEQIAISYVRKPNRPNWTYLISGENALFNPNIAMGWRDFELHSSEENALVIKILQLAGINIKDASLVQITAQEEVKKIQQEKS